MFLREHSNAVLKILRFLFYLFFFCCFSLFFTNITIVVIHYCLLAAQTYTSHQGRARAHLVQTQPVETERK